MKYYFPFGQEVKRLVQIDQTPKKVFLLGVYSSAVHAKWIMNNKQKCQALAVASEPYIFWDGNPSEVQAIIDNIKLPPELGMLTLPQARYNGPTTKALFDDILNPLGITRDEIWFCDLLPETRLNDKQASAIKKNYDPLIEKYNLNEVTIPNSDNITCEDTRRSEITKEIIASKADYLILIGSETIEQYLIEINCGFTSKNLNEYTKKFGYANPSDIIIDGHKMKVLPFTHPRQTKRLGNSIDFWFEEHQKWKTKGHNELV